MQVIAKSVDQPVRSVVIDIQLRKRHPRAFLAVATVVLYIHSGLEVQRLAAPRRADARVPLTVGGVYAQQPGFVEVDDVGEVFLQRHVGGDDDDPPVAVIRAHAHFGDEVAGLGFFLELVLQLDQRFLAVIGVDLADDHFAGGGHLVDGQGALAKLDILGKCLGTW